MERSGTNDYLSSARLCSKAFQMPLLCLMEVFIHFQLEFVEENIWIARRKKCWLISLKLIEFCFWQSPAGQVGTGRIEKETAKSDLRKKKVEEKEEFAPNICS